jgi:nucleoside-diphosphate-sugar epimerase
MSKRMKIVVIGGNGRIGTRVVNNLRQREHEVVVGEPTTANVEEKALLKRWRFISSRSRTALLPASAACKSRKGPAAAAGLGEPR